MELILYATIHAMSRCSTSGDSPTDNSSRHRIPLNANTSSAPFSATREVASRSPFITVPEAPDPLPGHSHDPPKHAPNVPRACAHTRDIPD